MQRIDSPEAAKVRRGVMATFDAIAASYEGMGFVVASARLLVREAPLAAGDRVLDLATGTGLVALAAAPAVGSSGRMVGIDIAREMLDQARQKSRLAGLDIEFREGDAEHLEFPPASFDKVLCASSLFFVPDMLAALQECHRVLKPGGWIGFTSFGPGFLLPLRELWTARLQRHGIAALWPPARRLEDAAVCRGLLEAAGFADVTVRTRQLGYFHKNGAGRWAEICAGVEGLALRSLAPELREQIRQEHMAELQEHMRPEGLWVDTPVHLTSGRRAP